MSDVVNLAIKTLFSGQKILVVGAKPSNLGKLYSQFDNRVMFWSSTERKSMRRTLPSTVGLVILTRFFSYSVIERLKSQLPKTSVIWHKNFGTGELSNILGQIFDRAPVVVPSVKPEIEMVPRYFVAPPRIVNSSTIVVETSTPLPEVAIKEVEVSHQPRKYGVVVDFVQKHVNSQATEPVKEINRLTQLSKENGLNLGYSSISSAFYKLKKKLSASSSTTTVLDGLKKASSSRKKRRNDSAKLLSEFCGLSELVSVAVAEIIEENKKLHEKVRQLEETLKKSRKAIKQAFSGLS